jgi:hypothetical protein
MAKRTLLEMTQDILSALDSDEVNSINDTVEATQVATIIRRSYDDIVSHLNLPEHYELFQLTASGTPDKPTLMTRPETIDNILWIQYNKIRDDEDDPRIDPVFFLEPEEFLRRNYSLNPSEDNIGSFTHVIGSNTFTFNFYSDRAPETYTTWDDHTLIFDGYDSEVDTTLQGSKTVCYGQKQSTFTFTDSFTPDLDAQHFSLLFNTALATAFAELKQTENNNAERKARRALISTQKTKKAILKQPYIASLPNYGRKR